MIKCPQQSSRAFTAIEMVAVLLLAAMTSSLAIVSMRGRLVGAQMDSVLDHIGLADRLARHQAQAAGQVTILIFNRHEQTIRIERRGTGGAERDVSSGADETEGRVIYRLPPGYSLADCKASGDAFPADPLAIEISRAGRSRSYAVRIRSRDRSRWLVVAGLTGDATEINDERDVDQALGPPLGDDAR